MAFTVAVKIQSFISDAWVKSPISFVPITNVDSSFRGDNRTFSSSDSSGVTYRTKQYLTFKVDNASMSYEAYADTGVTVRRDVNVFTKEVSETAAKASTSGITTQYGPDNYVVGGASDRLQVRCSGSAADPLIPGAPAVDYEFLLTLYRDGTIKVDANHDGYPCYEVYARLNSGSWKTLYQFTQGNPTNLFPPMEVRANKSLKLF